VEPHSRSGRGGEANVTSKYESHTNITQLSLALIMLISFCFWSHYFYYSYRTYMNSNVEEPYF